ncbi:MAG TPA: (2Fe-2S)-binding protein [Planctomycetes bacterium]|nr:(2Fe-2S)-binding protein [Planctomycetota bacterium]
MSRIPPFSRRTFLKGLSLAPLSRIPSGGPAPGEEPPTRARKEGELSLTVDGKKLRLRVEARTTLLELLRDRLGNTAAKEVCDLGACGACTVLLNGELVNACMTLAMSCEGAKVLTVRGLGTPQKPHPLQKAFVSEDALQCGYCTPGMVLAAYALLEKNKNPSRREIQEALAGNLCRCGTYTRIFEAVERAAAELRQGRGK